MSGRSLLLLYGICSHYGGFQRGDNTYYDLDHGSSHRQLLQTVPSLRASQNLDFRPHVVADRSSLLSDDSHNSELHSHTQTTNPFHRPLVIVLSNYAIFVFLEVSFTATFALFLSSPIPLGGLGLSPRDIGAVLGFAGIFHGLFQAFFFARIHQRWEPRNVYAVSIAAYIPIFLCMPTMNAIARRAGRITPLVWILLALVEMACTFAYTAFSEWFSFMSLHLIFRMTH
jgi:hypothetical protein